MQVLMTIFPYAFIFILKLYPYQKNTQLSIICFTKGREPRQAAACTGARCASLRSFAPYGDYTRQVYLPLFSISLYWAQAAPLVGASLLMVIMRGKYTCRFPRLVRIGFANYPRWDIQNVSKKRVKIDALRTDKRKSENTKTWNFRFLFFIRA